MAKIWKSVLVLSQYLEGHRYRFYRKELRPCHVAVTSGGFDPLHVGHLRCLQESAKLADVLVVVVNADPFLTRKKGYVFMPLQERLEIIAGLSGVNHVVSWDDGSQHVDGAIEILRPTYFTKGGNRSTPESIAKPEVDACQRVGCTIMYGVGGSDKIQSSSTLVGNQRNAS